MEKIGEPNSYKSENVQVLKVHAAKGVKSGDKSKRSQKDNVIIEIKGKTKQDIIPMKTRYSADAQANTRRRNQFKQKHKSDNIISKKLNSNSPVLKLMEINAVDTTKDPKKNQLLPKSKPSTPKPSVTSNIKPKTPLDKDLFTSKLTNILEKLHKDYNAIESAIPKPEIASGRTCGKPGTDKTLAYIQEWSNKSNAILKEKLIEMIQNQRTNMRNFSKNNVASTKTSSLSNKSTKNAAAKTKTAPPINSTFKKTINTSNVDSWQKHATNQLNISKPSNLTPQYYNPSRSCPMHTIVINKPLVQNQMTSTYVNNLPITAKSASVTMAKSTSMNFRKPSTVPTISHGATKDEVQMIRERVDEAIKQRKTFSICGNYYSIRNALISRGWIEKLNNAFTPNNCDNALVRRLQLLSIPELSVGLKDKEFGHVYRQVIQSKFIGNTPLALYWDLNRETYRNNSEHVKNALVNFISKNRFNYANKQGLCECIKSAYWYNNPGIAYLRVPRSYCLINNGDPDEFIEDFKVTAAMSFLKWIVITHDSKKSKLISNCGKIPIRYFHFALQECAKFAQKLRHEDIDKEIRPAIPHEWQEFLDSFYKVVHVGNHFQDTSLETELSLVHKSKTMLNKLRKMWPCVDMDGYMNIWILKPSYGSRGVGIYFCRTLQYVLKVLKEHKNNSYVIQKYIERPLLIHHTKFDIRQWFLISSTMPLTIWIYKECYLRFSSQTYNLRKLHESIHLTNNSVQSKYHNGNRDPGLPAHNMWFLREFKEHLTNLGYPHVYDDIIFPGIKECITAAVLATQDQIYRTSKAFELHGADFMITEDFIPWLIEINSKPALNPSTAVTSKLCPAVLEDVIKVVIDHARNPKAPTGNFELLYKEKVMTLPPVDDSVLQIKGQPIDANYFLTPEQEQNMPINTTSDRSGDSINIIKTTDYMKYIGKEMKNTLKQLLALVEKEKERRRRLREPNAAGEMDMESFECCEDMEKIKRNMKEIQEIFKFNEKGGKRASVNQICLPKASESLLRTNSNKIKEAIGSLENKSKEKEPSTSIFSNIMNMIEAFNYPAT